MGDVVLIVVAFTTVTIMSSLAPISVPYHFWSSMSFIEMVKTNPLVPLPYTSTSDLHTLKTGTDRLLHFSWHMALFYTLPIQNSKCNYWTPLCIPQNSSLTSIHCDTSYFVLSTWPPKLWPAKLLPIAFYVNWVRNEIRHKGWVDILVFSVRLVKIVCTVSNSANIKHQYGMVSDATKIKHQFGCSSWGSNSPGLVQFLESWSFFIL